MKYEDAYCDIERDSFSIDEVATIFFNDPTRYAHNFEGHMFCPCCRKVLFSFVNAKSPHFRGYANMEHDPECIYQKDEMSAVEVSTLCDSMAGEDVIVRQMDRMLIQFLRNHGNTTASTTASFTTTSSGNHMALKRRYQTNAVVPKKQLNAPFFDSDYGAEKLFYGKVHIKWEKMESSDKRKLLIWGISTKRLICKLFLTPGVYNRLPQKYKQESEYDAYIIFFASLKRKDYSKSWSQGNLIKSSFLTVSKIG